MPHSGCFDSGVCYWCIFWAKRKADLRPIRLWNFTAQQNREIWNGYREGLHRLRFWLQRIMNLDLKIYYMLIVQTVIAVDFISRHSKNRCTLLAISWKLHSHDWMHNNSCLCNFYCAHTPARATDQENFNEKIQPIATAAPVDSSIFRFRIIIITRLGTMRLISRLPLHFHLSVGFCIQFNHFSTPPNAHFFLSLE